MALDRPGAVIDYLFDEVSPVLVVGISVIYFVAKDWRATPYILVGGWMAFVLILLVKGLFEAYRKGWIRLTYQWLRFYLTKAWIKALLGLRYIRDNWIGRTTGLFAVVNLALFGPWIWYNLDPIKWLRSTIRLVLTCIKYIADPPELLKAFEVWKDSIPVFGRILNSGRSYVDRVIASCKQGSVWILVEVLMVTVVLGAVAILAYALWNWRSVGAWFGWLPPAPPAHPPDGDGDEDSLNDSGPKRKRLPSGRISKTPNSD